MTPDVWIEYDPPRTRHPGEGRDPSEPAMEFNPEPCADPRRTLRFSRRRPRPRQTSKSMISKTARADHIQLHSRANTRAKRGCADPGSRRLKLQPNRWNVIPALRDAGRITPAGNASGVSGTHRNRPTSCPHFHSRATRACHTHSSGVTTSSSAFCAPQHEPQQTIVMHPRGLRCGRSIARTLAVPNQNVAYN
jgi:hypothetical protein